MSVIYLLHFERRYPRGNRPQHYLGVSHDLSVRMVEHRNGNPGKGGALSRAMKAEGIGFVVARVWEFEAGTSSKDVFRKERELKRRKKHRRLCPICSGPAENLNRLAKMIDDAVNSPIQSSLFK